MNAKIGLLALVLLASTGCSALANTHNSELRMACETEKGGSACMAYTAAVNSCEQKLGLLAPDWSKRNCEGLN